MQHLLLFYRKIFARTRFNIVLYVHYLFFFFLMLSINWTSRLLTSKVQNPLAIFPFDRFLQKTFYFILLGLIFIIRVHDYHHVPLYFTATSLELSMAACCSYSTYLADTNFCFVELLSLSCTSTHPLVCSNCS